MAMKQILVDSSFLFALYDLRNIRHPEAAQVLTSEKAEFVIPYVVLTEAAFLFNRAGGIPGVALFLEAFVRSQPKLEILTFEDLNRAREIMMSYATARLDFVDCCLMAISERLNITDICTLDRRDFQIFRPKHCDYLTLLP